MKSLVGDILDFEQLQNGKFRKDEQTFNIRKTIKEVTQILEYQANKKGVEIHSFFDNFEGVTIVKENPTISLFEIQKLRSYIVYSDE